jgi:FkbH-like protein
MASVATLPWLPPAPVDFIARLKAVDIRAANRGTVLQSLAGYGLTEMQLNRLARLRAEANKAAPGLRPLIPVTLGIVANATVSYLGAAIEATGLRHGLDISVVTAPYDQVVQQALDPESSVNWIKPDFVLLALDYRGLPLASGRDEKPALDYVAAIRAGFHQHAGATCIVQTVPCPPEPLFGHLDRGQAGTLAHVTGRLNAELAGVAADGSDLLLDTARLAETVGLENWFDTVQWHVAKLPFAMTMVPLYADHVARLIAAARGRSRKVLVLDLDNTLWGGAIGDDGLAGIVLGQGDPTGEAFLAVQQLAKDLRARGVVLAVCSRNDEATARQVFRDCPEMLLRERDIAVFQVNWEDKPVNLLAIADRLSVGVDALVLIDDNPAEREHVRRILPQVAVPELPGDVAHYPRMLLAGGYFESVAFVAEDSARADMYAADAERAGHAQAAASVGEFLVSLRMVATATPFDEAGLRRITQLINKTNQFNLTTQRHSEAEVAAIAADAGMWTLQVRLSDRFGDYGMICVVIVERETNTWTISDWVMSCRVLGRGVERAVLNILAGAARDAGVAKLIGRFVPTGRNDPVRDHYPRLGFSTRSTGEDDAVTYELSLSDFQPLPAAIDLSSPAEEQMLPADHLVSG